MSFLKGLSKKLKIRKEVPVELAEEFEQFKDIKSIERIQTSAWLGLALTFCIFGLDAYRMYKGVFWKDDYFPILGLFHLFGLLFFFPAVYTTMRKHWIIQTQLRRGVVIWTMVVLTIVFMLGQAVLTYLQPDRTSLVMFLGYVFIANWMFAMSHKERILFSVFSFSVMAIAIFFFKEGIEFHIKVTHFVEVFFLSLTAFIFDAYDYNLKWANFMHLRQIELEKAQVRKLEEFKSRFFTNLTHELRTPLTMISGMAKEIAEDPQRWTSEGTEIIQRNAGNLLNLVNQILTLSKIESDSMPLNLTRGDIISYFGYVVDAFKGHAVSKQIKLHYLSSDVELITTYDPDKYMTILSNLLSNAIKFTPEGGNIYVEVEHKNEKRNGFLELVVRDTGIGIPPAEIDHIFERFYQAQNEVTSSGLGTGIGLSLVNEIVRMLGGEIRVKSAENKGTTFTITLPMLSGVAIEGTPLFKEDIRTNILTNLPPAVQERVDVLDNAQDDKPEVLVIDDNADVLKFLEICLSDLYRLTLCKDGQSGIDKAIEIVPDLILSDVLMPVKDGLAVCKELKNHPITSHIPIVLLSAKVDAVSRIAGLEAGADVYMLKPFEKQELRLQLHNLLERRKEFHQRYADPTQPLETGTPALKAIANEDKFVSSARTVVMEHLDDSEFSVTHFCRALYLSRTQLHKKLVALTGLSATLFIRQIRLLTAKQMLSSPELTIADIAYKVGFTDPNYFTRCYVQEFGESPSETRSKLNISPL